MEYNSITLLPPYVIPSHSHTQSLSRFSLSLTISLSLALPSLLQNEWQPFNVMALKCYFLFDYIKEREDIIKLIWFSTMQVNFLKSILFYYIGVNLIAHGIITLFTFERMNYKFNNKKMLLTPRRPRSFVPFCN